MHGGTRKSAAAAGALILVVGAALMGGSAAAATKEVKLFEVSFDPATTSGRVGDSVHWSRAAGAEGEHNVHQSVGIFHSGPTTDGPIDFTRKFSAGTFPYFCQKHKQFGMKGKVKVPVSITPDHHAAHPLVKWATASTNTGGRFDVQFKVGDGTWKNWLANTQTRQAIYGDDEPTALEAGETYRFRARSQKGDAQSAWSPAKVYTHD